MHNCAEILKKCLKKLKSMEHRFAQYGSCTAGCTKPIHLSPVHQNWEL